MESEEMQFEEFQKHWDSQPTDEIVSRGKSIVRADQRRQVRQSFALSAFFILSVGSTVHFFWASYFLRNEGLWIALTRCSLFALLSIIQLIAWMKIRREHARRAACSLDQRRCLAQIVEDLNREIKQCNPVHAIAPLSVVAGFVAISKWIDFRLGHDTPMECIVIAIGSVAAISTLPIAMWHYQQQFLIPRRDHIRSVHDSLDAG